jgi:hypothetical protein
MDMKVLNPLIVSCLFMSGMPVRALDNWTVTFDRQSFVYIPNDLKTSDRFRYDVYGPFDLNGSELKEWFVQKVKAMQTCLGDPFKEWYFSRENMGWSASNLYDDSQGKEMSVAYYGGLLKNRKGYIVRMLSDDMLSLLVKYGSQFYKILSDAVDILERKSEITYVDTQHDRHDLTQASKVIISNAIRTLPGEGVKTAKIEAIWVNSNQDSLWGGSNATTHIIFKDGTAYLNCDVPPGELDIKKSRYMEPDKWTIWRKYNDAYQVHLGETDVWKALAGSQGIAANPNQCIDGTYTTKGGSRLKGNWEKTITFYPDGRFEMTNTSNRHNKKNKRAIESITNQIGVLPGEINLLSGVTTSAKLWNREPYRKCKSRMTVRGRYTLDEYAITLIYDNGYKHRELFYFLERKGALNVVYGSDLYWSEN